MYHVHAKNTSNKKLIRPQNKLLHKTRVTQDWSYEIYLLCLNSDQICINILSKLWVHLLIIKTLALTESRCAGRRPGPWTLDVQTSEPPTTAVHPWGCHPVGQRRRDLRPWRGYFKSRGIQVNLKCQNKIMMQICAPFFVLFLRC